MQYYWGNAKGQERKLGTYPEVGILRKCFEKIWVAPMTHFFSRIEDCNFELDILPLL